MKLDDLRQAVRTADPAAVLVQAHILERLIQQVTGLHAFPWQIPHRECLVLDRQELFRYAGQDELDLEPGRLLPPKVILLARLPADRLAALEPATVLLSYWRRLFHAAVHRDLEAHWARHAPTAADVQARVSRLGTAAFAEIRAVLTHDGCLLPPGDDRMVYQEFAATYLELAYFAPSLLAVYFPGLPPRPAVELMLAEEVHNAAGLFQRTRPAGAPDPVAPNEDQADESHDYYRRLNRAADAATNKGNDVRAAILHTRAARVAPPALTPVVRLEAVRDLGRLVERLRATLHLDTANAAAWLQDLPALLDKADQGPRPIEAALLFDLQQACTEHEREAYALDIAEWLLSAGRRPLQRPLPGLRLVRIARHLRDAARRLTTARLADTERRHLAGLLHDAQHGCEERVRQRVGPALTDAFLDAGLQPSSVPERVAFGKMVEELLDRITEQGYFTFGDLRDVISRNGLKVPDLRGPEEFLAGDPLLRLDQRLTALLDGIYRRGDVYLRWLHRANALAFGTHTGRALTRFFAVPLGGAVVLTEGLDLLLKYSPYGEMPALWRVMLWLLTSASLLGLVLSGGLRQRLQRTYSTTRRALRWLMADLPARVFSHPWLRSIFLSWPGQLTYAYLFKPMAVWGVIAFFWPLLYSSWSLTAAGILFIAIALNSPTGQAIEQALSQVPMTFYQALRGGLLHGLVRWTIALFKGMLKVTEYAAHAVDEWLRFRGGDGFAGRVARAVLGLLWFPIGWILRFYLVVLIEPGFNPVKAPIAFVAAKFVYPYVLAIGLTDWTATLLGGSLIAWAAAAATVWLLPDMVAFLVWETKENWSLYRANRSVIVRPAVVGKHGETLKGLLKPGFHSGTVPRLFARLRLAEGRAAEEGDWRAVRAGREQLQENAAAVRRFVQRELVVLLSQCEGWRGRLEVGTIGLATNAIRVELRRDRESDSAVVVAFTQRAGWLVASMEQRGWLAKLTVNEATAFANALAGLYKFASVDLVEEQLRGNLPTGYVDFIVEPERIMLRPTASTARRLLYDLTRWGTRLRPENLYGARVPGPELDAARMLFRRVPLTWHEWEEAWQPPPRGEGPQLTRAGAVLEIAPNEPAQVRETPALPRLTNELPGVAHAGSNGTSE